MENEKDNLKIDENVYTFKPKINHWVPVPVFKDD